MAFDLLPLFFHASAQSSPPSVRRSFSAVQQTRATSAGSSYLTACDALDSANVFVGTSDGVVRRVRLRGKAKVLAQIATSALKPIESIVVLPASSLLAVLTDASLFFMTLELQTCEIPPIRAITAICRDNYSAKAALVDQISVAKRRLIQCFELRQSPSSAERHLVMEKDIAHTEGVTYMARSGGILCLADAVQYKLIHIATGRITLLFPYQSHTRANSFTGSPKADSTTSSDSKNSTRISRKSSSLTAKSPTTSLFSSNTQSSILPAIIRPHIAVVGEGEFLVTIGGPNQATLGMFMGASGDPVRGTIQWDTYPRSIKVQFPFVVSLTKKESVVYLVVHNLLTSAVVQEMALPFDALRVHRIIGTITLPNNDSESNTTGQQFKLLLHDRASLIGLSTTSADEQINKLLDQNHVEEATALAEATYKTSNTKVLHPQIRKVYTRSAFDLLLKGEFDAALPLLQQTRADPTVLVHLYNPKLCPSINDVTQSPEHSQITSLSLRSFAHLVALALHKKYAGNPAIHNEAIETHRHQLMRNALKFLIQYLIWAHEQRLPTSVDISLVLLHLYADLNSPELLNTAMGLCDKASDDESTARVIGVLSTFQRYNVLYSLYQYLGDPEQATALAKRSIEHEVNDPGFAGNDIFCQLLMSTPNLRDRWDDLLWFLKINPLKAVEILYHRADQLHNVDVLNTLRTLNNSTLKLYLLYMINEVQSKDAILHTALAIVYWDEFVALVPASQLQQLANFYEEIARVGPRSYLDFLRQEHKQHRALKEVIQRRLQFYEFIGRSKYLDANTLLETVKHTSVLKDDSDTMLVIPEIVRLLSKLGCTKEALQMCIQKLHDFAQAEHLCMSDTHNYTTKTLFGWYLQFFVDMDDRSIYSLSFAVMLRRNLRFFDLDELLRLLPDEMELALIESLLAPTARRLRHMKLAATIHTSLARQDNMQAVEIQLQKTSSIPPIIISEHPYVSTYCATCSRPVVHNDFVRDEKGRVRHPLCAMHKKRVQDPPLSVQS